MNNDTTPKRLWTVMKAFKFEDIKANGIPLRFPDGGPKWFMPMFETKEQAIAFDDGNTDYVREVTT